MENTNTIRFERQYMPAHQCYVVALDAKLSDFMGKPVEINGKPMVRFDDKTVKDCRGIDGCIYMHKGRVSDSVMTRLIELYQKACKSEKWQDTQDGLFIPDEKMNLGL